MSGFAPRTYGLALALFCLLPITAFAERDNSLAALVEIEAGAALKTIQTLAAIESGSGDAEGLAKVAEILEQRLIELDFDVRRVTSDFDVGADSLVGVKTGGGTHRIMLMAHMDTVFEKGTLATMPIKLDDNRLYGPGVVDAKGGIAIILHGLKILKDLEWQDYASLTVLFNPDEETGSTGSGQLISELAADMDTVLSFEVGGSNSRGFGWLLGGTAAYAQVTMRVTGQASHAGSDPGKGKNAVLELAHQLLMTKDVAGTVNGAQLNWTNVVSDKAYNQIPDLAVAIGDARITVEGAEIELLDALRQKVIENQLIVGAETSVSLEILRPGFRANAGTNAVAKLALKVHREISNRQIYYVGMVKGATDAGYAAVSDDVAVLEGLGPWGAGYHGNGEYLDVDSLGPTLYQFIRLIDELEDK